MAEDKSITEDRAKALMWGDYGKECAALIESYITAIVWNSPPGSGTQLVASNGTAFVVQIRDLLFVVTAGHVYSAYCEAKRYYDAKCRIGNLSFDPATRLIDLCADPDIDIATFWVKPQELEQIGVKPITTRSEKLPVEGQGIMLAGIPGCEREEVGIDEVIFDKFPILATATSVSARQITIHIDRDNTKPIKGRQMPPTDFDTSGMSGGPVLAVQEHDNGLVSFPLVGVIREGKGDTFFASKADVIQPDGTINRQYLP